MSLQIRRGTNAQRLGITPASGELLYTTDTNAVFVGDGVTAGGINISVGGSGNVTANLIGDVTGNVSGTTVTTTGNMTAGNIITTGNVNGSSINATANVYATYFVGDGSLLTGISASANSISNGTSNVMIGSSGGNVTAGVGGTANVLIISTTGVSVTGTFSATGNITGGNLSGTKVTGQLTTAAQPNITSVGTLTALTVTGNISGGNLSGTSVSGTLSTAAQPNITSVGTLGSMSVTGNTSLGNITVASSKVIDFGNNRVTNVDTPSANSDVATKGYVDGLASSGITVQDDTANTTAVAGGGTLELLGTANEVTVTITNTDQVTFGLPDSVTISANLSAGNIDATNTITAIGNITGDYFIGNGSQLTGITTSASPGGGNTQVQFNDSGTLGGSAGFTFNKTSNAVSMTGNLTAGNVSATGVSGTLATAAQPNITSVGSLTSLTVTGNASTGNISGTTGTFTNVVGTLTTAAQPNITSVGSLSSLTVTGNVGSGNVSGAIITGTTSVIGGGITLTANTISSAGTSMTIDPSAPGVTGTVVIAGNLQVQGTTTTIDSTTITINDLVFTVANNAATASAANGGGLEVGPAGSPYATWIYDQPNSNWSTALGITATGNISAGNLSGTAIIGTLATAAQPNITSVGTLSSLTVTGNVSAGNVSGTNIVGTLTTAAQPNITSVGTLGSLTVTGNIDGGNLSVSTGTITVGNIVNSNANGVGNIGSSTTYFNTVFAKATSAQYADLAEYYLSDQNYEPGTVVKFGGTQEITIADQDHDITIAGVVSTNPAYAMNAGIIAHSSVAVALVGRVPCKVIGPVRRGQMMVSAGDGYARAETNPEMGAVIGKALRDFDDNRGVIEIVVGRL